MNYRVFLICLLWASCLKVYPNVVLPSIFSDHMVLQQKSDVRIWGWDLKRQKVKIHWQGNTYKSKANSEGHWEVSIPTGSAGGPFELLVEGSKKIHIKDVWLGEVWLASGQSNMEYSLSMLNKQETIENADIPAIRFFNVSNNYAATPKDKLLNQANWKVSSPKVAGEFSATAYYFALELYHTYKVPIGIIESDWGGTPIETWISKDRIRRIPSFKFLANDTINIKSKELEIAHASKLANKLCSQDGVPLMDGAHQLAYDDWSWKSVNIPTYGKSLPFNGPSIIWLRKHFNLENVGNAKNLVLSGMNPNHKIYVNGHEVDRVGWQCIIQRKWLNQGDNILAMRLCGGIYSGSLAYKDEDMFLAFESQPKIAVISLAGSWMANADLEPKLPVIPRLSDEPSLLFNAMIAPLIPYRIKGCIWYQGESNTNKPSEYNALFQAMIQDWRARWKYEFSFLFVQLPGYKFKKKQPSSDGWAELREAQQKALNLNGTAMAIAIDLGEEKDIHPSNKEEVGRRLALAARSEAYHEKITYSGPLMKDYKIQGHAIKITFHHVGKGLITKGSSLKGFAIAGADKQFKWAKSSIVENEVLIWSDEVKNPVSVRYSWESFPDGNLYNLDGLPAAPFRTDTWELDN